MNTQEQARNLMVRQNQNVKNRQQTALNRLASEVGIEADVTNKVRSI